MTTDKLNINVAAPIVSYLGPTSADCRRPLGNADEDVFVDDEWDHELAPPLPSLFPLPSPRPSLECRRGAFVAPSELLADIDNIETFQIAEVCFDDQDYESAASYLSAIIRSAPHHTPALLLRGECYHARQQHSKAIADYNQVLEWGGPSECDDARLLMADCLLAVGEEGQALIHSERAVDATHSSDAYALRGRTLARLGNTEGARRDLAKAKDSAPADTHLILALENCLKGSI